MRVSLSKTKNIMVFSNNRLKIDNDSNIKGNQNRINTQNVTINSMILTPDIASKKKKSSMFSLLDNIEEMHTLNVIDELDTTPYCIRDKIKHNELSIYEEFYDDYQDDSYLIDSRIKFIEQNSNANFGKSIISYVRSKYRQVYTSATGCMNKQVLLELENLIDTELKDHYGNSLSPEELSYVPVVIFYVFKHCKIFEKP